VLDAALKVAFHHPRPTEAIIAIPDSYSFPSGHAVAASALYLTLAVVASDFERRARPRRLIVAGGIIICLLVAWSRVYLGVHYFTDVVGGLLIGTSGAIVAVNGVRPTNPSL
jgi:undecaprenyl-diphosphatase